jgi:hypothetical protein
MALGENMITGLSNMIGYTLQNVFLFFENLSPGLVIFLVVMSIFLLLMVFFAYIKKVIKQG